MKYYKMKANANECWFAFPQDLDEEEYSKKFSGHSLKKDWLITEFEYYKQNAKSEIKENGKSDYPPYKAHIPILSEKAVLSLNELLESNGELLNINITDEDDNYYIFNVTNVKDALDKGLSNIKYFRDSNRIMRVKEYVFRKEVINDSDIFMLNEPKFEEPIVSQKFVNKVEESGLKGFKFELIWED